MIELARYVVLGLAVGALYTMAAQGIVLIYRGSGIVSFAQGGFAMLGAYLYYEGVDSYGFPEPVAWVVALAVPGILGALTHLVVMRRLRSASPLVRLVATLGLFFLLIAAAQLAWGHGQRPVVSPLPTSALHLHGSDFTLSADRLWLILIAVVVTALLSAFYRWTRFGRATEAVAENPVAAGALGISPDRVATLNWAAGSVLAALAGILIAPILLLNVSALAYVVLRALVAALVGRFRSFWGTLGGALAVGVVESLFSRYVSHDGPLRALTSSSGLLFGLFSAQSVSQSAAFLIVVVVLVWAGRALPLRGELFDRLPMLGSGRIRWVPLGVAVVVAAAVFVAVPDDWATALITSAAVGIVCLSVVVVTGYVGQLSLAQMALAGFGAWVAGRLASAAGLPFLLSLIIGVVVAVPLGLLVAVPSLRTRGVNLAVLTFGFSVVISELVLSNSSLTGGFAGTTIGRLSLFGLDIDATDHPARYGIVVLLAFTFWAVAVANLRRGRSGRRMIAVRDNERAATALGISVAGAKTHAFGVGAAIAATGGILLAFRDQALYFAAFDPFSSVQVVLFTVIGGVGYVTGPVLGGAFTPGGLGKSFFDLFGLGDEIVQVVAGAVLLLVVLTSPHGMTHANLELARRVRSRLGHARPRPEVPGARAAAPATVPDRAAAPGRAAAPHPAVAPDAEPVAVPAQPSGPAAVPDDLVGAELRVENLTVRFGGVVAVHDVSLSVDPGQVVGLIGPNGAGKTTVIDAITGFVDPAPGCRMTLGGREFQSASATRRARLGIGRSFQSLELFEDMTVAENLLTAGDDRGTRHYLTDLVRPGGGRLSAPALAAVREFGLEQDLDRTPGELPLGRRRLVAIARAIAARPRVLLLDEPAAGLSAGESQELAVLIRKLATEWGLAILIIEHDVAMVMALCDRITVLKFGEVIADGVPGEIAADPAVVAAYLGEPEPALSENRP